MAIPTLTATQAFQNSCNRLITTVAAQLGTTPQSKVGEYTAMYNAVFAYSGATPAQVLTQLATNAGAILGYITALREFLVANDIAELAVIPAYTVDSSGNATLS